MTKRSWTTSNHYSRCIVLTQHSEATIVKIYYSLLMHKNLFTYKCIDIFVHHQPCALFEIQTPYLKLALWKNEHRHTLMHTQTHTQTHTRIRHLWVCVKQNASSLISINIGRFHPQIVKGIICLQHLIPFCWFRNTVCI